MKYVSLDLETTCIDPKIPKNILMLSMVVEDTEHVEIPVEQLPHFTCYFVNHEDVYTGNAYAISMNGWIFDIISGRGVANYKMYYIDGEDFRKDIKDFLFNNLGMGSHTIAGKNIAIFDYQFLPDWLQKCFKKRMIDPGSVFLDFKKDECIKTLDDLKVELGINGDVTHDARKDAMDVIQILRKKYE